MSISICELDYETASPADLKKVGLDVYTRHADFRVLMGAWSIDGGPIALWQPHLAPIPAELEDALTDPHVEKWAFNAQFERVVTRRGLRIQTSVRGWRCTQVLAALQSFGGDLASVGQRIGLPENKLKMKNTKRLLDLFTQPQRVTKKNEHVWRDWRTDPFEWEQFCDYCVQDVEAERAIRNRLIRYPIPASEWELYELDQIINDRGKPIDRQFIENAIEMAAHRHAELTSELIDLTGLANPGSITQLLPWLRERGYPFRDLRKDTVKKVITENKAKGERDIQDGAVPPDSDPEDVGYLDVDAVKALKLREWQARLSIKKYDAMLERTVDDCLRYMLQMAGAPRTARWAGRGPQPQNLSTTPSFLEDVGVLALVTEWIRRKDYAAVELFAEPMSVFVGCVRSSFRTPAGYQFTVADLKSIESAVIAWLTGCERLLSIFREGKDPYKDFATDFYHIPYNEVTRPQRKICKPPSLGCGYRLSGGMLTQEGKRTGLWGYAENMGVDITRDEAHRAVRVFRSIYPEIPSMWKALEDGIERTLKRKVDTTVGRLRFEYRQPYLLMWLPSGRPLYYYQPRLEWKTVNSGKTVKKRAPAGMDPHICYFEYGVGPGEEYDADETYEKLSFTYMGEDQKTRQWVRINSHGGRTIEQATQATAREVLKGGLLRSHKSGFYICSHVHDEIVTRQRIGENRLTLDLLQDRMREKLPWAPGLPLDAAGYSAPFYRKD